MKVSSVAHQKNAARFYSVVVLLVLEAILMGAVSMSEFLPLVSTCSVTRVD